jgi:IMP dehydrogenase
MHRLNQGFTYDDVLLLPKHTEVIPSEVVTTTKVTRNISLEVPILSAAMDTVTEKSMAIAIAKLGGLGIVHRNLSIESQVENVRAVKLLKDKSATSAKHATPKTSVEHTTSATPKASTKSVTHATSATSATHATSATSATRSASVASATSATHATSVASVDSENRLLVGAAVGFLGDSWERALALADAEVDVIVVDTAHGHSKAMLEMVERIKRSDAFSKIDIIGGNVATKEASKALIDAGVDAVKVGIGPGSICTTRIIAGVGVPQLTAVQNAYFAVKEMMDATGVSIPIIADGGIHYSGDIAKAIVAGADAVMLGSMLAGTEESPGELIYKQGKRYKYFRGMGSMGAMSSNRNKSYSKDRYFQADAVDDEHLIPEGVEAEVEYKGAFNKTFIQLVGGLHQSMFYIGARNIAELKKRGEFIQITTAGLKESHPHDIATVQEAPNY